MRIVAKIGTASITDDEGVIDRAALAKLSDEVAELRWFHADDLAALEIDPLNQHLLRDIGVLGGPAG